MHQTRHRFALLAAVVLAGSTGVALAAEPNATTSGGASGGAGMSVHRSATPGTAANPSAASSTSSPTSSGIMSTQGSQLNSSGTSQLNSSSTGPTGLPCGAGGFRQGNGRRAVKQPGGVNPQPRRHNRLGGQPRIWWWLLSPPTDRQPGWRPPSRGRRRALDPSANCRITPGFYLDLRWISIRPRRVLTPR